MIQYTNRLVIFLLCFFLGLLNTVHAYPENTMEEPRTVTDRIYGKVTATMDVSGYTYVEVDDGKNKVWAAGPITPLKIGDMIAFATDMRMENYHSKSMERDFSIIYFVERFISDKDMSATTEKGTALPHNSLEQGPMAKPLEDIKKVESGNTIAEIYAQKQELNSKTVRVRGKVVKVTNKVMGKNWLHIKDSSTADDLTVTTQSTAAIDDIVVVEGKLELDKDFSYGYVYPVIIEDAKIMKQ